MKEIQRIGVFTSGGDAPGMNAALRAVVRSSIYYKKEIFGIMQGYEGMIDGDIHKLLPRSVSNIIQHGGTMLKTARSRRFRTEEGRKKAYMQLKEHGLDALVAVGGDGTFTGLHKLYEEFKIPSVCIPGTIDNDLGGTDFTIGYDTAVNTAVEALDKIRDTAISHNRLFFIEVMGRHSGYIAVHSGVAGGAAVIVVPEEKMTIQDIYDRLMEGGKQNKKSSLVVVAEGSPLGGAHEIAAEISKMTDYFDIKVTTLGHLQRGGNPTCFDRVLAAKMGIAAVEGLLAGKKDVMVGMVNNKIVYNSFEKVMKLRQKFDAEASRINKILST